MCDCFIGKSIPVLLGMGLLFFLSLACDGAPATPTFPGPTPTPGPAMTFDAELVEGSLDFPTSIVFAPDGRLFVAERLAGRVRIIEDGKLKGEPFVELEVVTLRETGLLGVALHPAFPEMPYVYMYYTYRGEDGLPYNRVVRFRDQGGEGVDMEIILDRLPAARIHNGGVIAFGPDGKLYVAIGDTAHSALAQDLQALAGKVLRLNPDGSIPQDNPFPGSPVFSLGHRNIYGLAFHPLTGELYITENGPSTDDEVNVIQAGGNYGWPNVLGKAFDPRYTDPILTFTPNIAPTNALFYTGDVLSPEYRDNLFFGDWNTGSIRRVVLQGPDYRQVSKEEVVLRPRLGGVVGLVQGPDGHVYFTTPGGVFRLVSSS